jgi:UDP-2-acetamido-3-amino-2,3-dideoxy-glucuronate N-acetyltransferase
MLRLVCDKNKAIIADTHKKYPDVDVCFAFRDVLGKNDIDWVVLTTPVETHFPMAPEGLLSRKHVYVEKPLELEEKEAKLLISLAGERSKVLRALGN